MCQLASYVCSAIPSQPAPWSCLPVVKPSSRPNLLGDRSCSAIADLSVKHFTHASLSSIDSDDSDDDETGKKKPPVDFLPYVAGVSERIRKVCKDFNPLTTNNSCTRTCPTTKLNFWRVTNA